MPSSKDARRSSHFYFSGRRFRVGPICNWRKIVMRSAGDGLSIRLRLTAGNQNPAGCVSFIANGFGMGSSKQPDGRSAMKSTQTEAWGWLAAGVLALGLNGIYQDGGAEWVRRDVDGIIARIADRSEAVLALAAGRAD